MEKVNAKNCWKFDDIEIRTQDGKTYLKFSLVLAEARVASWENVELIDGDVEKALDEICDIVGAQITASLRNTMDAKKILMEHLKK